MPFSAAQAAGETLFCVVCGEGSCRKQWARDRMVGKLRVVACARHTDEEFSRGFQKVLLQTGKTLSENESTSSRWGDRATRKVQ